MKACLLFCLSFFTVSGLCAQNKPLEQDAIQKNLINDYFETARGNAAIYRSKVQNVYPANMPTYPYFKNRIYTKGTVCFDGIEYNDQYLRIDLFKNELILLVHEENFNLVLKNELVDYAFLYGYYFFYHYKDSRRGSPNSGYYMKLYESPLCAVLEREYYVPQEIRSDTKLAASFRKRVEYYILKDDVYYAVSGKKSVLNVLKSHKKELEQYIKKEKLSFKKNPEHAIVSAVKQYELLTL